MKDYPPYLDYPKKRKPQTNYDRIISKTPEELAVWFCQCMLDCCGCPAFCKCMKYDGDANERSKTAPGLVDWLKSPVGE